MNKPIFKTVSFWVGGILILLAGLVFVLFTDLYMSNSSGWLFFAIILAFGSGIAFLLSDSFKDKRVLFLILKVAGILLAAAFVVYLFKFRAGDAYLEKITLKFVKNDQNYHPTVGVGGLYISWIVVSILGIVVQIYNAFLHVLFRED